MKAFDIDSLRRDPNQGNLYNLFEPTFILRTGFDTNNTIVTQDSVMRMDLICNEIYKKPDVVDFLLNFNDIDNPLNIMEGDLIFFTSYLAIDDFKLKEIDQTETRSALTNSNKTTKIDPNRQKYIEENYSLPTTYLSTPKSPITFEGDNIVIGR